MKNAGYTLVEALVVVAILAIALTLGIMSINTVFALDVRQAAKELSGELSKEKIACMTRQGDVYLHLYKDNSGIWVEKYEKDILVGEAEKIGKSSTMVTYRIDDGSEYNLDAQGIYISFNRSDGSFTTIEKAWELHDSAAVPPVAGTHYYISIVISSQHNSRTIKLYPQTGKVVISG